MNNKTATFLATSLLASATMISGAWVYTSRLKLDQFKASVITGPKETPLSAKVEKQVLPPSVTLPITWGDLGARMVADGVIDQNKFEEIYASRGGLTDDMRALLRGSVNDPIQMTQENSGALLNLLWAFGLGNQSEILEKGPISDPEYGGAGEFASTGGWTVAVGNSMDHFSKHSWTTLSTEAQDLVKRVSQQIYRPCCNNSTYFPDCNHGMAMLGLLELMASQGVSEEEMYRVALKVNSYWFPSTYLTIAKYLESQGPSWEKASPQTLLGPTYSSASGYREITAKVGPEQRRSGGGCGV